jgi:hypothetical protein
MKKDKKAIPEQPLLQFFLRDGKAIEIYSIKLLTKIIFCLGSIQLDKLLREQFIKSGIRMLSQC